MVKKVEQRQQRPFNPLHVVEFLLSDETKERTPYDTLFESTFTEEDILDELLGGFEDEQPMDPVACLDAAIEFYSEGGYNNSDATRKEHAGALNLPIFTHFSYLSGNNLGRRRYSFLSLPKEEQDEPGKIMVLADHMRKAPIYDAPFGKLSKNAYGPLPGTVFRLAAPSYNHPAYAEFARKYYRDDLKPTGTSHEEPHFKRGRLLQPRPIHPAGNPAGQPG